MPLRLAVLAVLLWSFGAAPALSQAPKVDRLAAVALLVGDWSGSGEGEPGASTATRHVVRLHGGRFLQVEGRSVYPKQPKNPSGEVHTSTDLWSYDQARAVLVMRQFDSLGFVSTYVQDKAASRDGHIVLVSEQLENVPDGWKARYTYDRGAPGEYRELFELDPDGKGFKTYVKGAYRRAPAP